MYQPIIAGIIGSGLYGEVHKVHYKNNSYAGKAIHSKVLPQLSKTKDASDLQLQYQLEKKCNSLAENLSHPNLEQFFELVILLNGGIPMILTELMEVSLTEFLEHNKEHLHVDQEINLCSDMAQGIAFLHSQSLVHGNLHGNNVLISSDGHAKIADYLCPLLFRNVTVDKSSGYVAPEVFQGKLAPSKGSNIYTLGILFLQVITKYPPQPRTTDWEVQHDFTEVCNHPLLPLLQHCLEMIRPTIADMCDKLAQLIKEKESPQRMAYKLLHTTEPVSTKGVIYTYMHIIYDALKFIIDTISGSTVEW